MWSTGTVVHEIAVHFATPDVLDLAPAPRCAVGTALGSVPPAVHQPAAAVVNADIFASAPRIVVAAMASTGTAVHEAAIVFTSPDGSAPARQSAPAATASAVTFEIKLRTAARVGSDAAYTDTHAFSTDSAHAELGAPCTTTSHDITTPGSRSPPHPSLTPPLMFPPGKRGIGSCVRLTPPPGDGLSTDREAKALWSGHSSGRICGNGRRTGSAHRGKEGAHSPSS